MPDRTRRTLEVNERTYAARNAHDPDGRVVEDVHFTDLAGLMAQLGG